MKESLSAMMDAQLSEAEQARVLAAVSHDPELGKTWERYHLIRAVLSKELGSVVPTGLSDRIADRIRDLPPPISSGVYAAGRGRSVAKWVGSLALAASVAAVAILGAQWFAPHERQPLPQVAQQGEYIRAGTTRWDTDEPEVAKALNVYLVQHSEFTPTSGMNGVFSYVRVVGYDNGQ
ncbi:MAG: sigma-E factor negative regulatory protein [Woeseia sp.]